MSTRTMQLPLPIDPVLPKGFDNTPNEERSKEELDRWWDQPYLVTNLDGTYTARCLNGGAWDRATALARGATIEEVTRLALEKQSDWLERRRTPIAHVWGRCDVVIEAQRPDASPTILASNLSYADAAAFIERWRTEKGKKLNGEC
ncbi:hypothetical protein QE400_000072 [Xanthomonas sacchari]|uniref:DNA-binding protein n=1 Tax=Xanthomonas sacchari TaxID=56458 RepID=UPI0027825133|nr:DNA-binding protein [Xanthomonas sacchari]MDQ1090659.1 hypothetical protein [Xanthomonas sacchari]